MSTLRTQSPVRSLLALASSIALLASLAVLPACNTVKGAGKDLQQASEATEKAITGDKSADIDSD